MTQTSVRLLPTAPMRGRTVAMSPGEDGLIGIPFPEHSNELLSRLNAQRRSGLLCDLTLTSRGTRYPTHRSVMAAVSLYFRRLFGAEEGEDGGEGVGDSCSVCQLDCVSPDALAALLEFAYTATLTIRSSGMREVLKGAQLLGIQCVADACRDILGESGDDLTDAVEEAEHLPSRRKQGRCFVTRAISPVRPAWRSSQPEMVLASEDTPEYGLLPTQGREGHPPPITGQNRGAHEGHREVLMNGGKHWPQESTLIPHRPEDTPSEEEESSMQGQATPLNNQSQADGAGGGATVGGGRKRKSQTPQQCPVCQKIIHGAGKLPRHMRTHTGEKPFQCTACGVRFTRNDKLKIHMRKHTGERPYPCPSCPARFLHSYDLKNHLSLHSGDRPFECPLCHKAFAREDHLQRHRKGHSCLELRTRRPCRGTGPETGDSPPSDLFSIHQHPDHMSGVAAAQLRYPPDPEGHSVPVQAVPLLGAARMPYPELLWRAVGAPAIKVLDKGEGEHRTWKDEDEDAGGEEEE
ncbi:zinc finger and BTB domain-containing protein 7B-like isoform X1 [Myxocyprinus asiaticus]|uniref:zinc finger and BTB domain-containing protein 7B-like isoform X1 n=2 Tax=Myxocyprinus asiaticus TaxID=70543 RepID=UPI00222390A8|nr:zinc finger and BTB domain-containing protein 7B-like isoform X1 [Myxocyprinus asiaticus]